MRKQYPEIIPAILSKTLADFNRDLSKLKSSKKLNSGWVHVDFMDNELVPNQSILPEDLQGIDFGNLKKEAHLMVKNPLSWIEKLLDLGFERIIIHLEAEGNITYYIKLVKDHEVEVVLAINPGTSFEELEKFIPKIDRVLVMEINPGFQGHPYIPASLDKIKKIKSQNWKIKIEADGAITDTNAKQIFQAGADTLISGSYLIQGIPDQNLDNLTKLFS